MAEDWLDEYRRKRDPERTPEPFGPERRVAANGTASGIFVVQQHAARRMHWDLRLAIGGALVSWAVPRGPSIDPKEKRLAVRTEDHPLEYADFEGIIPPGNYGAGAMIVWDRGTYRTVDGKPSSEALARGKLDLEIYGHKLRGFWTLVRTKGEGGKNWLLLRKGDGTPARAEPVVEQPASVLSGLTVDELRQGGDRTAELAQRAAAAGAKRSRLDPAQVAPMHAETAARPFSKAGWSFEIKYDGVRILASRQGTQAWLYYRTGRDTTASFPEIARALRHVPCEQVLLDGEVVAVDEHGRISFERLQKRLGLTDSASVARAAFEVPVVMYCFDLLMVAGYDVRPLALSVRRSLLQRVVPAAGILRVAEVFEGDAELLFGEARAHGFEGIVAKRAASAYCSGRRTRDWLKIKARRTDDLVIVGYVRGRGSRAAFGALMLGWFREDALEYAGNVGSGLDGRTVAALLERLRGLRRSTPAFKGKVPGRAGDHVYVEPQLVAEVEYAEITEGGVLRQPVLRRLRDDKPPADCLAPDRRQPPVESVQPAAPAAPRPALQLRNLDKVFWPESGYTKGDLLRYYEQVWPFMAPYLRDRPVVLTRFPDGIQGKSFFQKNAPDFTPPWVETCRIDDTDYFVCNDLDTLLYVINSGCIPVHVWSARRSQLERPDWAILDLDPKGAPFQSVVALARHLHALLSELAVPHFAKTSGQDGLHVLIPLGAQLTHDDARAFAEVLARLAVEERPDLATVARPLSDRGGKVYLDYLQNGFGKTIVAPFSVRPRPGAPVSMPLPWREVSKRLNPTRFTIRTVPQRLRRSGDAMLALLTAATDVPGALAGLAARLRQSESGR